MPSICGIADINARNQSVPQQNGSGYCGRTSHTYGRYVTRLEYLAVSGQSHVNAKVTA